MAINKNVLRIYFPYCLNKQADEWVILNRNYKPIGFNTKDSIEYNDYPVSMKIRHLNESKLKKLSCNLNDFSPDKIYLYDDESKPTESSQAMKAYLQKLEILMQLSENVD